MKRGQITIFIVIGLIILLIIGLIIYLSRGQIERKLAARTSIAKVPQEVQPIYDYAEQCIYDIGKDAIQKLGERGGYITQKFYYNNLFLSMVFSPTGRT